MRSGAATAPSEVHRRARRWALVSGVVLGIGAMGSLDMVVFHQFLQWHHFYHDTTDYWRIFSDGALHVFTGGMMVLGAVLLWRSRRLIHLERRWEVFGAGVLLGAGGFQLFDGLVNHKVLRLHQVHMETGNLLPYDIAWNAAALALMFGGWLVWRRAGTLEE